MNILSKVKALLFHPIWHYSPSKIAALVKADWNDELVPLEKHEKACRDLADLISGEATVREISARNGMLSCEISTKLASIMAETFLGHLDESKAENYIEFDFQPRGAISEWITVTIKRESGKTPHQKRAEFQLWAIAAAKHMLNAEKINPLQWGQRGCDLLIDLRKLDQETYDREIRGNKQ